MRGGRGGGRERQQRYSTISSPDGVAGEVLVPSKRNIDTTELKKELGSEDPVWRKPSRISTPASVPVGWTMARVLSARWGRKWDGRGRKDQVFLT